MTTSLQGLNLPSHKKWIINPWSVIVNGANIGAMEVREMMKEKAIFWRSNVVGSLYRSMHSHVKLGNEEIL